MKQISSVYFSPFFNTYKFQYLGRLGGRQFKRYLAFNWFILQILFCYGRSVFSRNWLEGTCYLLVLEFCSALFPEFLATASTHLVTPIAVQELSEKKSFFQFSLTKRTSFSALGLWPIIWLLSYSSPSPYHAIHSSYYNDLYIPFSVQPVTECRQPLAFILTWIRYFVQQAGRGVDLHSYSSFNGQSLGPVNLNTEG